MDKISVTSSTTGKSSSNGSEGYCGHCSERFDYMVDPRELSCTHVYCLPCIQAELLQDSQITCATCKAVHKGVNIESLVRLDRLMLSDVEEDQPPLNCNVCKTKAKAASAYCIDCAKKLCMEHEKYHDEYQEAFSKISHKKISIEEYRFSPDRYEVKTCTKHEGQEVQYACLMCLRRFCQHCDTKKKCPADKGQPHVVKKLDDISVQYKEQLNKLLNSLSGKITEAYTLEKKTTADMTLVEDKVQLMNDEVDRLVNDQITAIRKKADMLKTEITLYRFQNSTVVNDFISELRTKKDDLGDLWKSTHRLMTQRHDTEVIQTYTQVHDEIKKSLATKFGHCQLPTKRMLIRTVEHRDIELRLQEMVPLLVEFRQRQRKNDKKCQSVCVADNKQVICGMEGMLELRDSNALDSVKMSAKTASNINGIHSHEQGHVALHWDNGKNYIILYSKQLEFLKLIGEFFRKTDKYSQLSASFKHIVALDPDKKILYVYNTKGEFLFNTKLERTNRPWGVQCLNDDTVLVSDFVSGSLRKYALVEGKSEPIWTCLDLVSPTGITTSTSGLIFVASFTGKKIYVISTAGKKVKEFSTPDLQRINEVYDITICEDQVTLACGNEGLIQFQMIYDALVY